MKFPKGKKVKPGDEILNAGKDEDVPSELKDPRLAAKERAKHRTQITAELFSEESRGIFHDISAAEMSYEVCFWVLFLDLYNYYFLSFLSSYVAISTTSLLIWLPSY